MASNIEIKAKCSDLSFARKAAEGLATEYPGVDDQTDTYFKTARGRFKLRESSLSGSYMIPYLRPDGASPKVSEYLKISVDEPEAVKELFGKLLGIHAVVKKRREIFLYKNVRIHLDEVSGLGNFIELEAVMGRGSNTAEEQKKVQELMTQLGIKTADLIKNSYENLITEQS